jgi:hypothetical protein
MCLCDPLPAHRPVAFHAATHVVASSLRRSLESALLSARLTVPRRHFKGAPVVPTTADEMYRQGLHRHIGK